MKRLLITGACGTVATAILNNLAKKYELVLCDKSNPKSNPQVHTVNLVDYPALEQLCEGIDCVIHLAGDPSPAAEWDSLLANNIIATQNIFRAALMAGCRRVVFASSIHTMFGYNTAPLIKTDMPTYPTNLYGASKVCCEAFARYYSQQSLSIICLRLGWVLDSSSELINLDNKELAKILTHKDLNQLIELAIETECQFGIFHAISNNSHCQFDLCNSRRDLGYKPEDNVFKIARKKHRWPRRLLSILLNK